MKSNTIFTLIIVGIFALITTPLIVEVFGQEVFPHPPPIDPNRPLPVFPQWPIPFNPEPPLPPNPPPIDTPPPTIYDDPPIPPNDPNTFAEEYGKEGGKDPVTIGTWGYIEPGNGFECNNSPNPFDFDNDSKKENMCYWYESGTDIFFVDFNRNRHLDNGFELLNMETKGYIDGLHYLNQNPETCIKYDCYNWNDINSNILIDSQELTQITHEIKFIDCYHIPEGHESPDVNLPEGRDRGFFIYGACYEQDLGWMYATQPTYFNVDEKR